MQRIFYTMLFGLAFIMPAFAQASFGVKGGLNLASINIDNSKMIWTWHAGAFSHVPIGRKVFFQPEILISRKGTSLPDFFYTSDLQFNIVYLSMPLLMGVEAGEHFSFHLGPELSYRLAGELEIEDQGSNTDKEYYKDWDFGLDAGITYQMTRSFGLTLRYCFGFTDVMQIKFVDENGQDLGGFNEGKNRVLQLSLSYTFENEK
ncbi:MAG: outer membrane beta-barrel protein [Saprospiraceae bacterium]|nr:outer membrane beta-barrel protein [Candidatus Opimibacter iunctus]